IQKTGPIPEERTMKIFNQICTGIQYAHNKGIIHRDIKPSNIMIDAHDQVKIMDFGIAKILGDKGMTRTGAKMGTLYYMSPEQVMAQKDIDHRTDIYSLGITLFEMLTGKLPFDTDTESDFMVMNQIVNQDLPDPKAYYPFISDSALRLIKQMTLKKREERINHLMPQPVSSVTQMIHSDIKVATENKRKNVSENSNMIFVEGGSFIRESATITVSSFIIGKYPVTQKEWEMIMKSNPSVFKKGYIINEGFFGFGNKVIQDDTDNHPVDSVSWFDAIRFCNLLSEKEGLDPVYLINDFEVNCNWQADGYRLPTEAEWEFAAKGGNQSKGYFYSGSNKLDEVGWYDGNSGNQTHEVGTKKANELGIYDMSGNVWEWCWDWYDRYSSSAETNPRGATSGSNRVNRGGSWDYGDGYCRVAYRDRINPGRSRYRLGFRLARSVIE
ncbi:MAG TPA: bifunctional serine/threonine-protein kinase/formylglycine-generating enzyme family protein, partial [Candidatus Cloacimonadota bacterium]|nr:bifunctional serine/threonine-protein kinase/formylglycine-generating enzyme family protein [Candidatus Cloacimonadota bacterium]